jgi:hypothetical protein
VEPPDARRAREFAVVDVHVHGGIRWSPRNPLFAARLFGRSPRSTPRTETRAGYGRHDLAAADVIFASTPDLREHVPAAAWLPNPIDLSALPAPGPPNDPPRFGHFVSSPVHKGTEAVVAAFRVAFPDTQVSEEGTRTRYYARRGFLVVPDAARRRSPSWRRGRGVTRLPCTNLYVVAIEAMALGARAASHRPEWYPGCPVGLAPAAEEMRALAADPAVAARGGGGLRGARARRVQVARTVDAYRSARG